MCRLGTPHYLESPYSPLRLNRLDLAYGKISMLLQPSAVGNQKTKQSALLSGVFSR
jgi:hypothetical protein